jgi:hypothetical protein
LKLIVTFQTVGAALAFENTMKAKQRPVKIIPTPRCLGVTCSYSAVIEYQQNINLSDLLQNDLAEYEYSKIYQIIVNNKGDEVYEPYICKEEK